MPGLGPLEAAVMDVLWSADVPLAVRDVRARLPSGHDRAYSTVMTVLVHLHRKGMVHRDTGGHAFRYRPVSSRVDVAVAAFRQVLAASGDARAALLEFVRTIPEEEAQVLREALARRHGGG